jgi:uncharacterized membrane protein
MPDSKQADDVSRYAAEVRATLAHLPDAEREVLLEDLESHLEEVASESGSPLQERLGNPADYAAELRAAYGSGDISVERRRVPILDRIQSLISAMFGTWAYRELALLLPQLRPGWWVLRAYLLVLFLALVFKGQHNLRPIPNPFTSLGMLEIVATVVAITISVRIGRRGIPSGAVWRGVAVAANVGIVLLAVPTLAQMSTNRAYPLSIEDSSGYYSAFQAGFYGPAVTNIYPYTKDGKALKEILLFDQNGRPLTVANLKEPATDFPVGSDGKPIANEYPLTQRHFNGDPVLPPRVALPPASQSTAPTPAPAPTPTP